MDPPAYSVSPAEGSSTVPTPTLPPATPHRSIQDVRALILGNAQILKPRRKDDSIELVLAKQKSPQASAEEEATEQHWAFLVMRGEKETEVNIIIKGEPKPTIEEALDWMLDKTEVAVKDLLGRHGKHSDTGCCIECGRALRAGVSTFGSLGVVNR